MLQTHIFYLKNNILLYNIFLSLIYIVSAYIIIKIINLILRKLEKKAENTQYIANIALLNSLKEPIHALIWSANIFAIFKLYNKNFYYFTEVKVIFMICLILWLFFRFINLYTIQVIEKKERERKNIDYGAIGFFKKIAQIFVLFFTILIGLGKLGVNFQSLMAIGGIGGFAVGFAAKDMLSNIFGGLMIYWDRPFTVGDWISSPDRVIEGDVEEIGWRQTRILSFAKYPIYVPNSIFTNIIVENKTRMKSRRINELLPLRYLDVNKIDNITKEIKEMLKNHNNINQRLVTIVSFEFITSPGAIANIRLYTFANTVEWVRYTEIKQDVLLKVIKIIQDNGAELSYNISEIFIKKS